MDAARQEGKYIPKQLSFGNTAPERYLRKRAVSYEEMSSQQGIVRDKNSLQANATRLSVVYSDNVAALTNRPEGLNASEVLNPPAKLAIFSEPYELETAVGYDSHLADPDIISRDKTPMFLDESLSAEDRYLMQILGRRLTPADREEYYWDELPVNESEPVSSVVQSIDRLDNYLGVARTPVEQIGRMTLGIFRLFKHNIGDGSSETMMTEEMRPAVAERPARGRLSDMMISVVAGVLIATCVVFPCLKLVGNEVFYAIAKSTVRKIGRKVSLDQSHDSSILIPLITEQMLHPSYQGTEGNDGTVNEGSSVPEP